METRRELSSEEIAALIDPVERERFAPSVASATAIDTMDGEDRSRRFEVLVTGGTDTFRIECFFVDMYETGPDRCEIECGMELDDEGVRLGDSREHNGSMLDDAVNREAFTRCVRTALWWSNTFRALFPSAELSEAALDISGHLVAARHELEAVDPHAGAAAEQREALRLAMHELDDAASRLAELQRLIARLQSVER